MQAETSQLKSFTLLSRSSSYSLAVSNIYGHHLLLFYDTFTQIFQATQKFIFSFFVNLKSAAVWVGGLI